MPAPDRGTASLGAPVRQLAGGYRLQVVSEGPEHTGRAVRGVLWLWPTSSRDSSVRTGRRAVAGDTARHPLFGATDLRLWDVTRRGPSDERRLRARTDPVYPQVMAMDGVGFRSEEASLWVESVANMRDGSVMLDGAGYLLLVTAHDSAGFRGRWGPAGIVRTESGYFCARRLRDPAS